MGVWLRRCICSLLLLLVLLIGLTLLIAFPLAIFPALVDLNLPIQTDSNGKFTTISHYWWKLPAVTYYDFYFFNITNMDSVLYEGAQPALVEIGPYSYREYEEKRNYSFYDNDRMVYYENFKKWIYSPEQSCEDCTYEDVINLPNAAYVTTQYLLAKNKITGFSKTLTEILAILLGEYPFRTVPMKGVLFLTYYDPLLAFLNSEAFTELNNLTGGNLLPFDPPDIKELGYFPNYNNTADESYRTFTGKGDLKKTTVISQWANSYSLSFWNDDYANNIQGATDGAFNPPHLKKKDKLSLFISLGCRTFYLDYDSSITVRKIPGYKYKMTPSNLDTNLPLNQGFRYNNTEDVDYFPAWPCGGDPYNASLCNDVNEGDTNCFDQSNFCSPCCHGSSVIRSADSNDVVRLMPPGIIPLGCLPGQNKRPPFAGFLSPPHFAFSPPEVLDSLYGLTPDINIHHPAVFDVQPITGSSMRANFRLQTSFAMFQDRSSIFMDIARSALMPTFWLDTRVVLEDYVYDYLHLNVVLIPTIAMSVGFGLVGLVLLFVAIYACCKWQSARKGRATSTFAQTDYERYVANWEQ